MPETPLELRTAALMGMFEEYSEVDTPLSVYWPLVPNPSFGTTVSYDVVSHTQKRGRVNTRSGRANYESGPTLRTVTFEAETWREGRRIKPATVRDLRRPGSRTENRGSSEVARQTLDLHNSYERFVEWLRAEGLQGVKTFYPPGLDETYEENLLTDTSNLVAAVAGGWDDAMADEAAARDRLEEIRVDFETAALALAEEGLQLDTVLMNSATRGYIDEAAILSGYEVLMNQILEDGHITELFGYEITTRDETYVHPITETVTYYIPDNAVVFTDSNNSKAGRQMVECEAVDDLAPDGHMGLFTTSRSDNEAPGGQKITAEWTGGPMITNPAGVYVLQDVTNEAA